MKDTIFKRIRVEILIGVGLIAFAATGIMFAQSEPNAGTPMATPSLNFTPTSTLAVRSAPGEYVITIAVDEAPVYTSEAVLTREEANDTCERYAFDVEYMWQPVQCTWGETVIYHDIFVAG